MVYDDVKCCDNGHRFNILDSNHTHVSLGIAYNKFYLALVQNFENKDTLWSQPITFNNVTKMVSFSGQIKEPNTNFSGIIISYDPLPSKQTYDDNHDRKSYDGGKEIAWIVEKIPSYFNSSEIKGPDGNTIELITASIVYVQNQNYNQNSKSIFDISFSLQKIIERYGNGVYTVNAIYDKDGHSPFQATTNSIFVK
jgi:hypothetical protein